MNVLFAALGFAVQLPQMNHHWEIGGGYRVVATRDGNDANQSAYYAATIEIRQAGKTVETMPTRSLVDSWLKSDAVWGHEAANQMRFLDTPKPGATGLVQATVYEVVPDSDGFLVRIAVIDAAQSLPRINYDVIVQWQKSAPDKWRAIYTFADGCRTNWRTVLLPHYGGFDYLLDGRSLYRLARDPSQRTLVTALPPVGRRDQGVPPPGWFGLKQLRSKLVVWQPGNDPFHDLFEEVDLVNGKIVPLPASRLKRLGVERPIRTG